MWLYIYIQDIHLNRKREINRERQKQIDLSVDRPTDRLIAIGRDLGEIVSWKPLQERPRFGLTTIDFLKARPALRLKAVNATLPRGPFIYIYTYIHTYYHYGVRSQKDHPYNGLGDLIP